MFLWWRSTKIVQAVMIREKKNLYLYQKLKKSSCQKPLDIYVFQYNLADLLMTI